MENNRTSSRLAGGGAGGGGSSTAAPGGDGFSGIPSFFGRSDIIRSDYEQDRLLEQVCVCVCVWVSKWMGD